MKVANPTKKPILSKKEINLIVKKLKNKEVKSIILYGSQLSGNISKKSDIDLLVVIRTLNKTIIKKLIENKIELEKIIKIPISLNIHTSDELNPLLKKRNIFIHKNRSEFIIYKYKYHYLCVYGKNPFELFKDPSPKQIREEVIRLLLSFSYNLKKFILNPDLAPHKEKEFIRTPLIALEYIAAFYGYISLDKYDAFQFLIKNKFIANKHIEFIKKIVCKGDFSFEEKVMSINFIDYYRKLLIRMYLTLAQSDIRYVNKNVKPHYNLKYPQAVSMAIVKHKDKILLLKRTSDDYLYPNKWTLPGGYLEKGETFNDCIKREIIEEIGLKSFGVTPLFKNKRIINRRVAIGCFLIDLKSKNIKLSEHSNSNFLDVKKIEKIDLTPECREVLREYFNL